MRMPPQEAGLGAADANDQLMASVGYGISAGDDDR